MLTYPQLFSASPNFLPNVFRACALLPVHKREIAFRPRRKMGILLYRCPNTWQEVRTSIDVDPLRLARLRTLKISAACPRCIGGHKIPANEMYFREEQWCMPYGQPGPGQFHAPSD